MVFFNFETFAGGHALFSKIIYDLFSFSPLSILSLIIPLEEFRLWCSETDTLRLKKVETLSKLSVWDLDGCLNYL